MNNILYNQEGNHILSLKVYQYILETYGKESGLTSMCFDDILLLRVHIDIPLNVEVGKMLPCTCDSIKAIYDLYVNEKVPFRPEHIDLLKKTTSLELIQPFFESFSLPF